ncbi:ATP-binding protein [Streptomyces sp. Je 1-79]|uniref:sensor histidine kinase n=1 Tax=Streptomyces sp. Je 1-79 TaxID=2943847 RepID=UPI0021A7F543|nr:ATP-binding protein [Streptomyces sp. Je 1-79]MCT4353750.1 ATP-binding protein [Streptomyces sp. Je 1-79]
MSDRTRRILSECREALRGGADAFPEQRPVPHCCPRRPGGARTPDGTVPVHALRAGSSLVQVVAEFLERSLTRRPTSDLSRTRLMAMLQAAVARSLEDGADGHDLHLLDVVRESARQSREAMAREIHDRIGSAASLALRQLELYELTQNVSSATDPRLDSLKQAILETMHSTRDVVTELRTGADCGGSLQVALSAFVTAMAVERPVVEIRIEECEEPLPDTLSEHLFLVLRECLRNALAHAHASRVTLDVRCEARRLRARVADDGVGLPQERKFGNGLASVLERIRIMGGRMEIESAPGRGTTFAFSVPMGEESHADVR